MEPYRLLWCQVDSALRSITSVAIELRLLNRVLPSMRVLFVVHVEWHGYGRARARDEQSHILKNIMYRARRVASLSTPHCTLTTPSERRRRTGAPKASRGHPRGRAASAAPSAFTGAEACRTQRIQNRDDTSTQVSFERLAVGGKSCAPRFCHSLTCLWTTAR